MCYCLLYTTYCTCECYSSNNNIVDIDNNSNKQTNKKAVKTYERAFRIEEKLLIYYHLISLYYHNQVIKVVQIYTRDSHVIHTLCGEKNAKQKKNKRKIDTIKFHLGEL